MRRINAYGPSIIVLATVIIVLVIGPGAVRHLMFARTEAHIVQARQALHDNSVLEAINDAHRHIATIVEPSVVYISTEQVISRRPLPYSSGSGWVYDEEGHIITNAHVVEGATRIEVQLADGRNLDARLIGTDAETDIAVIKVDAEYLHPATRGSATDVQQGDQVFAFGSPFDFRFSMSAGIVSGLRRSAGLDSILYENFIQVDAAINPGNSGGPLTNSRGEVIGMNTAIATSRQGSSNEGLFAGIGLAIPIDMIESTASQLIQYQVVVRSVMGVALPDNQAENEELLSRLQYNGPGVAITAVYADTPAQETGLREGDIIVAVDGEVVRTINQLQATVSAHRPGDSASISVKRLNDEGAFETIDATLVLARRDDLAERNPLLELLLNRRYGFQQIATATPEKAGRLGVPFRPGVLILAARPGSDLASLVEPGTVIVGVDGQRVGNVPDFLDIIYEASSFRLTIEVIQPDGSRESFGISP